MCKLILIDQVIKNLLNFFFPEVCYACNESLSDNEKHICTQCRHNLPITNYHFTNDNSVEKVFYGRVKIENATSLFHFHKKGIVQQLIHNLKYKVYQDIAHDLGACLGNELKDLPEYNSVNYVIPVPLHKRKLKKRGFNQVTKFGEQLANALNANYNEAILIKTSNTSTQVFKNRISRWNSAYEIFDIVETNTLKGKHILLVDDIITTGATIESCVNVLNKVKDVKISVATMAIA